ncbi:TolC family protein [Acetobacter cerevisiae]|uniref:RND transporter n=1 Tax=Acetobacter cerevisiae TaxID=178900 RepID=A0A149Q7S3_9PROT|nr:TolC family protein [Acetobacter cerevisiae]KXU93293.1 RND transporter [Acetobacter cerevisiae]GBQ10292.1 secretion system type I outer membrane efflux pump lipoprotein NodT [Acetobacter cerevisiae DSM 14362]
MPMSFSAPSARLLLTTLLCSGVVACSPFKTKMPASQVAVPTQFTAAPASTQATDLTAWWTAWQDPLLNQLVQQALAANPDIRVAQARVQESRAYTQMAKSALYPTIGATAGMMGGGVDWRHPVPPLMKMAAPNIQDPATDGHLAGITMAWEPDIWGGNLAKKRGAKQMALASEEMLHGTHMAIAADVAANYVTARGLQQRIVLLDQSVSTLQSLLRYASARFDAGQTTQADLETIRGQIAQAQAQRPMLVSSLDACRHRLAILSGQPPEQAPDLSSPAQYRVPAPPTTELPSTVLERRPDVRLEKHVLEANLQRLISTKTDLLPRFGLEFFGGDGRLRFDGIPGVSGSGGLMAVNAYLPIFTAGRIQAKIQASDAQLHQALATYDQTVLTALAEVEDAYESRSSADQNITSLTAEVTALTQATFQARGLYEGGQFTMQDVLTTRIKKITAQDDLVSAQTRQALSTIQLARALGGGWSSQSPS